MNRVLGEISLPLFQEMIILEVGELVIAEDNLSHTMLEIPFRFLDFQEINIPHVFILGDISFFSSHKYTLL